MLLSPEHWTTLRAALDTVIPPGHGEPGAGDEAALPFWERRLGNDEAGLVWVRQVLDALEEESEARYGLPFPALDAQGREALLLDLEADRTRIRWPVPAPDFVDRLTRLAAEATYADEGQGGNPGNRSWRALGFRVTDGVLP